MNRPLPHIGPTLGQRQAMRYAQVDRSAVLQRLTTQNAVLATEQAHEEARQLAAVALRPEPAAFVAANDAPDPACFVSAVDEPVDESAIRFGIKVAAALIVMAGVAVVLRDPVARLLVMLGVLS